MKPRASAINRTPRLLPEAEFGKDSRTLKELTSRAEKILESAKFFRVQKISKI